MRKIKQKLSKNWFGKVEGKWRASGGLVEGKWRKRLVGVGPAECAVPSEASRLGSSGRDCFGDWIQHG